MAGKFDKVEIAMRMLQEDSGTPRSVREKLGQMIQYLNQNEDDSTKISNILSRLEELCNDVNIPPFVRTQIYSISSMLEAIEVNS
jgi:uncharacterized protein (UPF0147 family)